MSFSLTIGAKLMTNCYLWV